MFDIWRRVVCDGSTSALTAASDGMRRPYIERRGNPSNQAEMQDDKCTRTSTVVVATRHPAPKQSTIWRSRPFCFPTLRHLFVFECRLYIKCNWIARVLLLHSSLSGELVLIVVDASRYVYFGYLILPATF